MPHSREATDTADGAPGDKVKITSEMIRAGEEFLQRRYRDSPRLLADASRGDISRLLIICLGQGKVQVEADDVVREFMA